MTIITTGTNVSNTSSRKHDRVTIGDTAPSFGVIEAYSDDTEILLDQAKSAHVLFLQHAALKSFNFKIPHNHVIDRIEKLYRAEKKDNGDSLSFIFTSDPSSDECELIMAEDSSQAHVSNEILTLTEGGY